MKDNVFGTDSTIREKKNFLQRIGVLFTVALCLTGLCSLAGLAGLVGGIRRGVWQETGMAAFVWKALLTAIMILIFCSLVKIAIDEKPFSRTLTWCIRIIGILLVIGSFVIPRLQGYQPSGFKIISSSDFVLIDGAILLPGLLLIILASIIMAGFTMQKEMEEIL